MSKAWHVTNDGLGPPEDKRGEGPSHFKEGTLATRETKASGQCPAAALPFRTAADCARR